VKRLAEIKTLEATIAAEQGRREALAGELEGVRGERNQHGAELERRAATLTALEAEIARERSQRETLAAEIERIKDERGKAGAELAERSGQIAELNARLAADAKRHDELRGQLTAAEAALTKAHAEAEALKERHQADAIAEGDNYRKAMAANDSEKQELALRLAALEDDYAALRAENTELRKVAGAEWESEREENRRLRERLNEIAAGVVRLTQAMTADASAPAETAASPAPAEPAEGGTLADRLRAVQRAGTRH
jgi:chromosome segregation ATPase